MMANSFFRRTSNPCSLGVLTLLVSCMRYVKANSCGTYQGRAANDLRINNGQILSSHNSYHVGNSIWTYTHPALSEQLRLGVRSFELDIWYEVATGELRVLHFPGADEGTTCNTLTDCLSLVRSWSDDNPWHFPLFFQLELLGGMKKGTTAADQCLYDDVEPVVECAVQQCVGKKANELKDCVTAKCSTPALAVAGAKSTCISLLGCLENSATGDATMTVGSIVALVQGCVGTSADSNTEASIDPADYPSVAQNLKSVLDATFPESKRIAPKDIFTGGMTESSALDSYSHATGNFWPEVNTSRGKVIFWLTQASWLAPDLPKSTRPVFVDGEDLAIVKSDDPAGAPINGLVNTGRLVRTRSDEDLILEATRRASSLDSGAFVVSTDLFPTSVDAPSGISDWPSLNAAERVWIPLGTPVRCNPITLGATNCAADMLEDPNAVQCPTTTGPTTSVAATTPTTSAAATTPSTSAVTSSSNSPATTTSSIPEATDVGASGTDRSLLNSVIIMAVALFSHL